MKINMTTRPAGGESVGVGLEVPLNPDGTIEYAYLRKQLWHAAVALIKTVDPKLLSQDLTEDQLEEFDNE